MNHSRRIALLSVTEGRGHGAEVVLMEMLRGWIESGVDPVIIAPEHSEVFAVAEECGFETLVFPSRRDAIVPNLRAAWQLRRQIAGMVGIHGWTARTLECVVAMKSSAHQRIWATLHDHPRAEFHGSLRRWVMKNSSARLNALVTVSQAVANECQSAGFKVPARVIHNGLNQPDWATTYPEMGEVRQNQPFRIVFPGMYSPGKGFEIVRKWIEETVDVPQVEWHLFGEIWPGYQSRIQDICGLGQRVFLHGRVPIQRIYEGADLLVHASTSFDSLPTVLMEAARSGIPVMASIRGGAPEIVVQNVTGHLFDPDNIEAPLSWILECCHRPDWYVAMGHAARRHFATSFQVQNMVQSYADFWIHECQQSK